MLSCWLRTRLMRSPAAVETSQEITVYADADETPYILLAFDSSVTEEEIRTSLSVTKKDETDHIDINWVGEDGRNRSHRGDQRRHRPYQE